MALFSSKKDSYFLVIACQLIAVNFVFFSSIKLPTPSKNKAKTAKEKLLACSNNQNANGNWQTNAVILILARNEDADSLAKTLSEFEYVFNSKYQYPYVFLNNKPFSSGFKNQMRQVIDGTCDGKKTPRNIEFGVVPKGQWALPSWIDTKKAEKAWKKMEAQEIVYGGSENYRHMCRYFSGFFYKHPLLETYDYYWRIEPGVSFNCHLNFDPFLYMVNNNKSYGYVIQVKEIMETVPSLFDTTITFIKEVYMSQLHDGKRPMVMPKWNGCHYFDNFEIASFSLFRSANYQSYFDYLDRAGGIYYERWGDAPIHTMAVQMFVERSQIHHFKEIGYYHAPHSWCPPGEELDKELGQPTYAAKNCFCQFTYKFNAAYRVMQKEYENRSCPHDYHIFKDMFKLSKPEK